MRESDGATPLRLVTLRDARKIYRSPPNIPGLDHDIINKRHSSHLRACGGLDKALYKAPRKNHDPLKCRVTSMMVIYVMRNGNRLFHGVGVVHQLQCQDSEKHHHLIMGSNRAVSSAFRFLPCCPIYTWDHNISMGLETTQRSTAANAFVSSFSSCRTRAPLLHTCS